VALDRLKTLLSSPPVLVAPEPCEPLLLYLVATNHVVSAALVVEREEQGHALKVQRPVYLASEVLTDTNILANPFCFTWQPPTLWLVPLWW
jgi:hypothetical protein